MRGIGGGSLSQIAGSSVSAGVLRRAVVGVDHVAGAAAAGAVVAGLIVGAGKRQQRIEQARLLQSQKDRIGAQLGAEAALAQFDLRLARLFFEAWIPDFWLLPAASFEDAQDVAGLRNFPALQRIEIRQHSFLADLFRRGRRKGEQSLRFAVGAVAFAKAWGLQTGTHRCCRAPRPTAWRRGSSCWFALFGLPRCGSRWCRRFFRRRAGRPG